MLSKKSFACSQDRCVSPHMLFQSYAGAMLGLVEDSASERGQTCVCSPVSCPQVSPARWPDLVSPLHLVLLWSHSGVRQEGPDGTGLNLTAFHNKVFPVAHTTCLSTWVGGLCFLLSHSGTHRFSKCFGLQSPGQSSSCG